MAESSRSVGTSFGLARWVSARATRAQIVALVAAVVGAALFVAQPGHRLGGTEFAAQAHPQMLAQPLPLPLAAVASSRLGESSPAYWPAADGPALATRGGGIVTRFTAAGARLDGPSGTLTVALVSLAGTRVSRVSPSAAASAVVYRQRGISERYQAGPYGLEQSFVVGERPLRDAGRLVLSMRTGGSLRAHASGSLVAFSARRGGRALVYGGLSARDSRGTELRAHLGVRAGMLQLVIDDRGARYPIRIDPFFEQGSKLTGGAEETGAGELGASVALSADGNTALVGAPGDNSNVGAAWIFTRSGTAWEQQGAKLTGGEETGNGRFGFRVALSADGNTALIGGPFDRSGAGAAWVFARSEGKWEQQGAKLVGGEENGSGEFGIGVALSSDGNTAVIGGSFDNSGAGAIWAFTRSEGTWTQQGPKLTAAEEVGAAHFGFNVALSEDGNTAVTGGGNDSAGAGAAWAFTRSEGSWTQQGPKLIASGETGPGHFGFSVAVSADGNTAMIGGVADNSEVGAAWPFVRSEGKWAQQGAKLTGTGEMGKGLFGGSVSLASGGNLAVIGASADNTNVGAAWVFRRSGSTWEQFGAKLTGGGESGKGRFGDAVSLSSDSSTAIVGGNADAGEAGAAWPFANVALAPTVVTGNASAITETSATLNATVNPNGETVIDCHFNYGTTTAYGSSAPCSTSPGSGGAPVAVSAPITGLSANTVYHFQIVATNATGTSEGGDQTFASPNPPEFGRCLKLAAGVKGKFSNSGCTLPATAEKFSYEWEAGLGPKRTFTTVSALAVTMETHSKQLITCKAESGGGEYTSPKSVGTVVMAFTGCEFGGAKCTTGAGAEGEVLTTTLEGTIAVEKTSVKGLASNKIALDLFPVAVSGAVMEFTCGTTPVVIKGSVLVPVKTNKMLATETLKYAQTGGKQKPEKFEGMPADVLQAAVGGFPFEQMGLAASLTQTNAEKLEVNTVV